MRLEFSNPVFHLGVNVTVRRGIKWAMEDVGTIGEITDEWGAEEVMTTVGLVTRVMRFCDLQNSDLVNYHDPHCRTVEGLLEVMHQVYTDFDPREIVTLVEFER